MRFRMLALAFSVLIAVAFVFQNCAEVNFEPGIDQSSIETPFETENPAGTYGFKGNFAGSVSASRSVSSNGKFNLFYLIDVSGSVQEDNMRTALTAFSALTRAYNSSAQASLSIVRFRGSADLVGRYSNYASAPNGSLTDAIAEFDRGIDGKFRPGTDQLPSGTNYGAGLEKIRQELNQVTAMSDVTNVFYFFTDGEPNGGSISNPTSMGNFVSSSGFGDVAGRLSLLTHAFGAPPIDSNGVNTLKVIDNTPASPIEVRSYSDLAVAFDGTVLPGSPNASGKVTLSVEPGVTDAIVVSNGSGTYGTYSVDRFGNWTYSLNEASAALTAALSGLSEGQHIEDRFAIESQSGKYSAVVIIKIFK